MPPGTRTAPRSKAISRTAIEKAESFLQELPKKEKQHLLISEAISGIADTVRAALAKGYSYDEISVMLSDKLGISISTWSLRRYIPIGSRRGKRGESAAVAPKRRARKMTVAADVSAPIITAPESVQKKTQSGSATTSTRKRSTASGKAAEDTPAPTAKTRRTRGQTATTPKASSSTTPASTPKTKAGVKNSQARRKKS